MDVDTLLAKAQDSISVRRVYGEPIERDGVLIIPAAKVGGGGGGGVGEGSEGPGREGKGTGTGFGIGARPVGAFVVKDGEVTWQPAVDVTRIVLGGQIVAIVGFLTLRKLFGRRHRQHRAGRHRHAH
jgi:uncharacterized spore protein YtfJ